MRRLPNTNFALPKQVTDKTSWFRVRLLEWFVKHERHFPWRENGRTSYEILLAEILLQRTTAASVARHFPIFVERYPAWSTLRTATIEELEQALRPVGLWRQKATTLYNLCRQIESIGNLVPSTRQELEALDGVGQYTASAILCVLYEQSEPLIDVNMARVLERFFGPRNLADIRDDPYLQTLARKVVEDSDSLKINWAILDFSALVCKANVPECLVCPLQLNCDYFKGNNSPHLG